MADRQAEKSEDRQTGGEGSRQSDRRGRVKTYRQAGKNTKKCNDFSNDHYFLKVTNFRYFVTNLNCSDRYRIVTKIVTK